MAEQLLSLALVTLVVISVGALLVLVLRRPVARWLGARWAYRLWLVPLLAVAAVLLPTTWFLGLVRDVHTSASALTPGAGLLDAMGTLVEPLNARLLLGLWLSGAVLSLCRLLFGLQSQAKALEQDSRRLDRNELKRLTVHHERLPALKNAQTRMMRTRQGPALAGLSRPTLYLPSDFFDAYDVEQQRLMLRHESTHLQRNDLRALLVARLVRCAFWFNPLILWAEARVQTDQELACDERVLDRATATLRRRYGDTLIQAAHTPVGTLLAHYAEAFAQLLRRVVMIKHHRQRALRSLAGATLLFGLSATAVVGGAVSSQQRPEPIRPEFGLSLAEILGTLQCGEPDPDTARVALQNIRALVQSESTPPLNDQERALLMSVAGLAHERLGAFSESLGAYQNAARLAPDGLQKPLRVTCDVLIPSLASADAPLPERPESDAVELPVPRSTP